MIKIRDAEEAARGSTICPACGDDKQNGALVCWRCFKAGTPNGAPALKWSELEFSAWLEQVRDFDRVGEQNASQTPQSPVRGFVG